MTVKQRATRVKMTPFKKRPSKTNNLKPKVYLNTGDKLELVKNDQMEKTK